MAQMRKQPPIGSTAGSRGNRRRTSSNEGRPPNASKPVSSARAGKAAPRNPGAQKAGLARTGIIAPIGWFNALSGRIRSWDRAKAIRMLPNLVPVIGVAFMDWDLFSVVLLYWSEMVIVSALCVPRVIFAEGFDKVSLSNPGIALLMLPIMAILAVVSLRLVLSSFEGYSFTDWVTSTSSIASFCLLFLFALSELLISYMFSGSYKTAAGSGEAARGLWRMLVFIIVIVCSLTMSIIIGNGGGLLLGLILFKILIDMSARVDYTSTAAPAIVEDDENQWRTLDLNHGRGPFDGLD